MSLINHFVDIDILGILIPDEAAADTTNGVESIVADSNGCAPLNGGRAANFVLMDWVANGNFSEAIAILNGVSDTQKNSVGELRPVLQYVFSTSLFLLVTISAM